MNDLGTLHVYGAAFWHDDVWIVGTESALANLAEAIALALKSGRGAHESCTSDGEGFSLRVLMASEDDLARLQMPYSDEVANAGNSKLEHPSVLDLRMRQGEFG